MNRLLLVAAALLTVGGIVSGCSGGWSDGAEIDQLRQRLTTEGSSCSEPSIQHLTYRREASWTCQLSWTWDQYREFLQSTLKPEYHEKSETRSHVLFTATTDTDQYLLEVVKTGKTEPLEIRITQKAYPF